MMKEFPIKKIKKKNLVLIIAILKKTLIGGKCLSGRYKFTKVFTMSVPKVAPFLGTWWERSSQKRGSLRGTWFPVPPSSLSAGRWECYWSASSALSAFWALLVAALASAAWEFVKVCRSLPGPVVLFCFVFPLLCSLVTAIVSFCAVCCIR